MAKGPKKYSELAIYSPKISPDDYKSFFDKLIKKHIPIFEFLDTSRFFSFRGINIVIKRYNNTIKMFVEDRDGIYSQSALLFPLRLQQSREVEMIMDSKFSPGIKFINNVNLFDFLVKENVEEIRIRVIKVFGGYFASGNFINSDHIRQSIILSNPNKFLEINLEKNPLFYIELLDPVPKMIYFDSKDPIFDMDGVRIGVENFSPFQHSLIVGTSGCGKSKLLEILIRAIKKTHADVRIVMIDPHGEFSKTFKDDKVIDFVTNYVEPFDVGKSKSPLITQLVSQLITSTIGQDSTYAERIVFYSVHLLSSIDQLSLENINVLLTDSSKRMEFVSACNNDEVRRFFDQEFQDIYMHHFNDAILPVTNFIGEYQLYLGKDRKLEDLAQVIKNNRVTIISFNPHFFGRKIIKFFAGSIINQMYIMAISEKLDKKTILVVDEFPTVESKVVKDILAETRKFNLYLYASAQYLGQLSKVVLDSLISNCKNIIAFRVTKEDARLLSSMMEIKVEEFFKKSVSPSELEESKREMFVKLHTQECIVRLFDGDKYILPMRLKTVDFRKWAGVGDGMPPPSKGGVAKEKAKEKTKEKPSAPKSSAFNDFKPMK